MQETETKYAVFTRRMEDAVYTLKKRNLLSPDSAKLYDACSQSTRMMLGGGAHPNLVVCNTNNEALAAWVGSVAAVSDDHNIVIYAPTPKAVSEVFDEVVKVMNVLKKEMGGKFTDFNGPEHLAYATSFGTKTEVSFRVMSLKAPTDVKESKATTMVLYGIATLDNCHFEKALVKSVLDTANLLDRSNTIVANASTNTTEFLTNETFVAEIGPPVEKLMQLIKQYATEKRVEEQDLGGHVSYVSKDNNFIVSLKPVLLECVPDRFLGFAVEKRQHTFCFCGNTPFFEKKPAICETALEKK